MISVIGLAQRVSKIGSIHIKSNFYIGRDIIIQGGVASKFNDYNDFRYSDTFSTIMSSAKLIKSIPEEYKIGIRESYPHPFQISYFDQLRQEGASSYYFFVGNNNVDIKLKDLHKEKNMLTGKLSKENTEYLTIQNLYRKFVNSQTGEIYDLAGKLAVMQQYISQNPNSIVALWDLVLNYYLIKHDPDQRKVLKIIQNFSDKVKSTKTFQAFTKNILGDLQLVEGKRMPNFFFEGHDSLFTFVSNNKYTLIDFWFSRCAPCITQFEPLKFQYEKYQGKGFTIIGISVDMLKNKNIMENVLKEKGINWINLWDIDGSISYKNYIHSFPTNFLLDNAGKIIKKDISMEELDDFLKKNLN